MQNDPIGATAEGMSTASRASDMTRRLFLGRAAVIAPMAAIAPMTGLSTASAAPAENPALLALLPRIEAAGRAYAEACVEEDRAFKVGSKLWPRAPRIIKEDKLARGPDIERGISGRGYGDGIQVSTTATIAAHLRAIGDSRMRGAAKARRKLQAELEAARHYEEACDHARAVSGFPAARAAQQAAQKALEAIVRETASETARTMEGVRIKAIAIQHWKEVPAAYRVVEFLECDAAGDLAAAILDILEPVA